MCERDQCEKDRLESEARGLVTRGLFGVFIGAAIGRWLALYGKALA